MPRKSKGARLYLDPTERTWAIRHLGFKKRTGFAESERPLAEAALARYLLSGREEPPQSLIYFISAAHPDYPVKVGITSYSISGRLMAMQVGNPFVLVCLGTHPGTADTEVEIHKLFRADHIRGEWFRRSPALMNYISANTLVGHSLPDDDFGRGTDRNTPMFSERSGPHGP